jgi:hypothetical protein
MTPGDGARANDRPVAMAILALQPSGPAIHLLSRHLVGRSRSADLPLAEPLVSGEHATLHWTGSAWELHDLGSRNGTFVDGRRLAAGERVAVARGALIAFGDEQRRYCLVDDSPPTLLAVPADGGEPIAARDELIALPSEEVPEVVAYRDAAGEWVIERGGGAARLLDRTAVQAGGRALTLRVPELLAATWDGASAPLHLAALTLCFAVSRDEEYVQLVARAPHRAVDLGARAHHAVLLALARGRLADRERGTGEGAAGWMYHDELARQVALDEPHLNVAVFRCRRQFAEAGIGGAASVIERRRPTRELRIGVARIEIATA